MAAGTSSGDQVATQLRECFSKGASRDLIQELIEEHSERPKEMEKAFVTMFRQLGIIREIGGSSN
jgi:hypothetical protein